MYYTTLVVLHTISLQSVQCVCIHVFLQTCTTYVVKFTQREHCFARLNLNYTPTQKICLKKSGIFFSEACHKRLVLKHCNTFGNISDFIFQKSNVIILHRQKMASSKLLTSRTATFMVRRLPIIVIQALYFGV